MSAEVPTSAVELRGVAAGYDGRWVVSDVTFDVPAGHWLAVIGPNGAGKSTLLKAIAGLAHSTGEIRLAGVDRRRRGRREVARLLGYAPQTPILPDDLTVTDYVLLGRTPHLSPLAREGRSDLAVVDEVLTRLDLTTLAHRRLYALSGGERQRAVLARTLAQQASILLLDEPTTGLDLGHAQVLLELVDGLRTADGTTVVTTLHDLTFAAQYADTVVLVNGGKVVAAGPPSTVLTAELLAEQYAAELETLTGMRGDLVIAPVRKRLGPPAEK